MTKRFKTAALVGLYTDKRVAGPMQTIATHLQKVGLKVLVSPEVASELNAAPVKVRDLAKQADLIIAVGGDGTMLYAARQLGSLDVPLLGVNRGRLGFLADVSPTQMLDSFDRILAGDYTIESRLRLEARLEFSDGTEKTALALNDIVLQRQDTGRMLDFETRIAGRYVNTHMGDGLIIATPTGSTAYAISCGGPILEPKIDAVALVPICPHILSDRSIVIPASQQIDVQLLSREGAKASVSVDGQSLGDLTPENRLTIAESSNKITLIHPPGYDYYEILRSKLHWGKDSRKSLNDE